MGVPVDSDRKRPPARTILAVLAAVVVVFCTLIWFTWPELGGRRQRTLPNDVFDAVEADPAMSLTPPDARAAPRHRREVCIDGSGDMPSSWREFRTPASDETVLSAFVDAVPHLGWELNRRWTGGGNVLASGASFSRLFGRREVELVVYAMVDDDSVLVEARIPCDQRSTPISREIPTTGR